ncbi:COMPASS (complex proteins associated with Set1p) component [Cladophialophora chaetospira]|uniref:COMPASS (Complex proteins associated with Set1p) component n=1 Tax=Cladophialophora chaetospira TaxID=386627 RepID=A0AA38X7U2_9EURO|nr:COMPASS (complex proteins associated with Set1p) component [Cladophialophora chaetospira]
MAFSLSELLNPEPADGATSSLPTNGGSESQVMDPTEPAATFFAPELFQPDDDAPPDQDAFDRKPHIDHTKMDDEPLFQTAGSVNNYDGANEEDHVKQEVLDTYPPLEGDPEIVGDSSMISMRDGSFNADDSPAKDKPKQRKHPGKSRKVDPESGPKSSVHSSKNEGQHTDRRYLCYLCNKLFTRRRSVRDHISKIHNTKTWEPVRSLEVVVDPDSGEPIEPIEDVIARGPPPPPPKQPRPEKTKKTTGEDEDEEDHVDEHIDKEDEKEEAQEHKTPAPVPPLQESSPPAPNVVTALKKEPSVAGSRASSTEPFATPAPVAGKKRPAPDDSTKPLSAAARKKGTAKVKSAANKKPKLSESEQSPPASRLALRSPSATPSSHQLKPLPSKLKKQTSAASVHSSPSRASSRAASREVSASPSQADTPTSSNDDGEVFCICRKGDNHTWMIACDGGCDEWFHGNCVSIKERDGELIDKYICPTCKKPGLQTTWKRMCRRKDCRKPARVTQVPPSKYCSDACGRMFFVELVQRGDPRAQSSKNGEHVIEAPKTKKYRKKHTKKERPAKVIPKLSNGVDPDSRLATPAYSDEEKTEYETDSSLDDEMLPNRGAALRAGEVKALIDRCQIIDEWKALGRKPDTPPRDTDVEMNGGEDTKPVEPELEYDDLELAKLAGIEAEKTRLKAQDDILTAREQFVELVKVRSGTITDEIRKSHPKMKDLCGFDPRVAWSDEEFSIWYNLTGGKAIIDAGANAKIGPPEDLDNEDKKLTNGTAHEESAVLEEDDETDTMPKKGGVCIKNRCPRHRNWAKGQLAEIRFEQDLVRRALQRHEVSEEELRGRAVVRAWEKRG